MQRSTEQLRPYVDRIYDDLTKDDFIDKMFDIFGVSRMNKFVDDSTELDSIELDEVFDDDNNDEMQGNSRFDEFWEN
jgi:hypothetical protein